MSTSMDLDKTIEKYLPIEKTEYGFVQKNFYQHAELYDEEVVELDSPFASSVNSKTKVFTFLLLGDQNAGKSTFLHAFTNQNDKNWTELTSYFPLLSSKFLNTRFHFDQSQQENSLLLNNNSNSSPSSTTIPWKPMDEPPFLDTDLARLSCVMTAENFKFFLSENNISHDFYFPISEKKTITSGSTLFDDVVYVAIQFIELGGDHLDSLMKRRKQQQQLQREEIQSEKQQFYDVLDKSLELLKNAKKTIYFVNTKTLFDGSLNFRNESIQLLLERLNFLNGLFPKGHEILFCLSRISNFNSSSSMIIELFRQKFQQFKNEFKWNLGVSDIFIGSHLNDDEEQSLSVSNLIGTLVRCFDLRMANSQRKAYGFVVNNLFNLYKKIITSLSKEETSIWFPLFWINKEIWLEFLDEQPFLEIPGPTLLQLFEPVVSKLCNWKFGIAPNNLQILLKIGEKLFEFKYTEEVKGFSFRFPHFPKLFNILIERFVSFDVPEDVWITTTSAATNVGGIFSNLTESERNLFSNVLKEISELTIEHFKAFISNSNLRYIVDSFVWIAEEYCLVSGILEKKSNFEISIRMEQSVIERELKTLIVSNLLIPFSNESMQQQNKREFLLINLM